MVFLDPIDRKLIRLLRRNARMKVVTLAKAVGLSRSATHDRIIRLESEGVIQRYTIEVNPSHEADARALLIVSVDEGAHIASITDALEQLPGLERSFVLSGGLDIVVKSECARNAEIISLRDAIQAVDGVRTVNTHTILSST